MRNKPVTYPIYLLIRFSKANERFIPSRVASLKSFHEITLYTASKKGVMTLRPRNGSLRNDDEYGNDNAKK